MTSKAFFGFAFGDSAENCFVWSVVWATNLHSCGTVKKNGGQTLSDPQLFFSGAGDGNRTRVMSLEGSGSTIELHPR